MCHLCQLNNQGATFLAAPSVETFKQDSGLNRHSLPHRGNVKPLPASSSIHVRMAGVRLYRDDVERILSLLAGAGLEVKIKDDAYEYTSLDEVSTGAGRSPRCLKIRATMPDSHRDISLDFDSKRWSLHTGDPSLFGVARECEAYLRQRQTVVEHLPLFWIGMPGWVITSLSAANTKVASPILPIFIFIGLALLGTAGGLWLYLTLYPRIILRFKHEAGFLSRNREQLILVIGATVAGAVITELIRWILGQLETKP